MMTKTDKFLNALLKGDKITTKQAVSRFKFASANSTRSAVTRLRELHGYDIVTNRVVDTKGRVKFSYQLAA